LNIVFTTDVMKDGWLRLAAGISLMKFI